jgi:hypothetical protein
MNILRIVLGMHGTSSKLGNEHLVAKFSFMLYDINRSNRTE